MQEPIRRAILICSQTPNGNFLPGVENDISAMKTYLKSPNGGVFRQHEIITLNNPTTSQVFWTATNTVADYLFIYFSGHGFTRNGTERMICLTDGNLKDTDLLNNSPRQLIIVDACRTHERPAAIGAIPWPEEKWDYFDGYSEARAYFDRCIINSPMGKMIVHATSDNAAAFENRKRNGGEFTLAMLDTVFQYQQTKQQGILFVETVVQQSRKLLQNRNVSQVPCIFSNGQLKVPFGIISPEFIQPPERKRELVVEEKSSANALLVCAGLALILIAAAKN
jgi:hypothetical protein